MDPLINKYSVWKRLVHKFQARRDIPFRKKFFIGYDLHGNTYWEFSPDGNLQRLRRKMEPFQEYIFKADYFSTVPPQWLQWLRRTRSTPPTLQELINEQQRQQNIKVLAKEADEKWQLEKMKLEQEQQLKLDNELKKVEEAKKLKEQELLEFQKDPWGEADKAKDPEYNPIESANIKIRK